MSRHRIAWQEGEGLVRNRVESWLDECAAGGAPTTSKRLAENSRRALHRLDSSNELEIDRDGDATMRTLVVKIHFTHSGSHRRREAFKRRIGYSPALREWRALSELHAAHVPVPEPRAWGVLPSGDALIVSEYFEGRELTSVLSESTLPDQLVWIDRLAASVQLLHAAGFRHGDLHLGNLHARADQVMILDLQRARPAVHRGEFDRDLAHLDFSIARMNFDIELRARLKQSFGRQADLDRASRRFVRDFMRGRSRREFQLGHAWERWPGVDPSSPSGMSGLRDASITTSILDRALAAAQRDPRPGDRRHGETRVSSHRIDARSLVLKRSSTTSQRQRWGDRLRGSSAYRSFRNGQKLSLLGPLGARPLAAVEEFADGAESTNWLILESVGRCNLDEYQPASTAESERCAVALARWIAEWHAWGIDHRDLKASNIRFDETDGRFRFWLIDLEDVRFRRSSNDSSRLRALVQLNASLDDGIFSLSARKLGLDAYLARLPFKRTNRHRLIESIAKQSLARGHRWQAKGCDATRPRTS